MRRAELGADQSAAALRMRQPLACLLLGAYHMPRFAATVPQVGSAVPAGGSSTPIPSPCPPCRSGVFSWDELQKQGGPLGRPVAA